MKKFFSWFQSKPKNVLYFACVGSTGGSYSTHTKIVSSKDASLEGFEKWVKGLCTRPYSGYSCDVINCSIITM